MPRTSRSGGPFGSPRTPPWRVDRTFGSIALAFFAVVVTSAPVWAQDANAGKAVYERKCVGCHGEKGDGKGPAAELLLPKPRDFTKGLYKIRSTANKTPTDQDLVR